MFIGADHHGLPVAFQPTAVMGRRDDRNFPYIHESPSSQTPIQHHDPLQSPPLLGSDTTGSDDGSPITPSRSLMIAIRDARLTSGPSTPPTPVPLRTTVPMRSASQLKRSFSELQGRAASGKRLTGENDPENREILRLRQEENKEFDDIAQILNKKRVKTGTPPVLTANAIYSRYKRNGPLIAASAGKEFVPTALDKKSNGASINFKKATPIVGFNPQEDEFLVNAVADVEARKWELVSARIEELGGNKHDPDMCALRFNRL